MSLSVSIRHRLGDFTLEAGFTGTGRLTALFGPSGSGKTSIVNIVAGLTRPDEGRIVLGDTVLLDTEARIAVPRHRRRIGYVFQEARLFPHLTVRQNLLYGRWFAPKAERWGRFADAVELLGLAHLVERGVERLSGGERSRVAIGRALLSAPRLLLMDEPLAALDAARKSEILPYIERLRDEIHIPILYVTHALSEIVQLASDMVVLERGRVVAHGTTTEILSRIDLPSLAAERDAGAVIDTVVEGHDDAFGLTVLGSRGGRLFVPRLERAAGTTVRLRIAARDVILATGPVDGLSALNLLHGTVADILPAGEMDMLVRIDCQGDGVIARLTRYSAGHLGIAPGRPVTAVIKSVAFDRTMLGAPPRSGG